MAKERKSTAALLFTRAKLLLLTALALVSVLTPNAAPIWAAEDHERADGPPSDEDEKAERTIDKDKADDSNQDKLKLDNRFDGSQFNPPSFVDTDFSGESFIDLLLKSKPKKREHKPELDDLKLLDKLDRKERHKDERDDEEYRIIFAPPPQVKPNDWLPSGVDPLWNGGFTTPPDNGAPVPYHLNGHVDIERGRPWLHHDN
jgi:hypothetical protein